MKILWFTNIPMPDVHAHFNKQVMGTGGWMGALLDLLKNQNDLKIGVVTASGDFPDTKFNKDGVDYFVIKQKFKKIRRTLFDVDHNPIYLKKCMEIVHSFKPDLVHIHGTERFYGQMVSKGLLSCPAIFSIQGILDSCCQWYRFFGTMSLKEIIGLSLLSSFKGSGLLWSFREIRRQAAREREYFESGSYFFGRTKWDKAYVKMLNSNARYFHVPRVLREPFWEMQWELSKCRRHRIIFTNARHPRKGIELLLDAVEILKASYPDIELVLIGSLGYEKYGIRIKNRIDLMDGLVKSLGPMDADRIAKEICQAHVFASASYIENSPNSIAEAQLVGMPVVSSYTGGVPSMIKEGETGIFFPTGDVPSLINAIEQIFQDDAFAARLGNQAREIAVTRHDPAQIAQAQINAYNCILSEAQSRI